MSIRRAMVEDAPSVAALVGDLLAEIMSQSGAHLFHFDLGEATKRLEGFIADGRYLVFVGSDGSEITGFIALYESYALYAEGAFGTIPELYVRPAHRSAGIGAALLAEAKTYGLSRGWTRLEVTTPPLPDFERTLAFYQGQGFSISGGRKLKLALS